MGIEIREITAKSILTPQGYGSLSESYDFSLNPYSGCAFACSYCYVPKFPNGDHSPTEWGQWVKVKVNAPELIRKDRLKVFSSRIFFSSATDPYQYIELKYRLSRRCLEELRLYQPAKITMHTRSHLILRDLDLLKSFGKRLTVGVSFTTNDDEVRREFEPKAPSITRRLELLKRLKSEGIKVYASVSPLLPCDPKVLIDMISPYVDKIWIGEMRWTEVNNKPQLLQKYAEFFKEDNHSKIRNIVKASFIDCQSEN